MKKRFFQIILPLIAIALISSSPYLVVYAQETSNSTATSGSSAWTLGVDTFDSNGVNNSVTFTLDHILRNAKNHRVF